MRSVHRWTIGSILIPSSTLKMPRIAMMVAPFDENHHPCRCDDMCRYQLLPKACLNKGLFGQISQRTHQRHPVPD